MTKVRQPDKTDKLVGRRLKELRGDKSLSAFAKKVCVNEEMLPQWEEGTVQPGKATLCFIARKHGEGLTIHHFFDGSMPPKEYPS